jgi:hypothetical protein
MKKFFTFSFLLMLMAFFVPAPADAALPEVSVRDTGYAARYVGQSIADPIKIEVGETVTVNFQFKNVGTKTWDSNSNNYISAYTMEPRYRSSLFQGSNWLEHRQTAKISGIVKPGETGILALQLTAPEKPGEYTEKFWLAADSWSWVKDGYFYAKIIVVEKTKEVAADVPAVTETPGEETENVVEETKDDSEYKAKKLLLNKKEIVEDGGERIKLILGYQNLGETTWERYSIHANEPARLSGSSDIITFADEDWQDADTIVEQTIEVPQWGSTRDSFYVRTPAKKGSYTLMLTLKANDTSLDDIVLEIPVTVTADAPSHYEAPAFVGESVTEVRLESEPTIRVGLWKNPDNGEATFVSGDDDYVVYAGTTKKGILPKGSTATLSYRGGFYSLFSTHLDIESGEYIRLVPKNNPHAVFELTDYDRHVTWKGPSNFNKYRGSAELRRTTDGNDNLYIINELLYEDYIAGIAETSNASPIEYIKSILTAARTYAYYVAEYTTKHDGRHFDVFATTGDQLYLGYVSEELMPRVASAARATRGMMITYNDDIVITPYFGNSDGRTRSWTEVWGGSAKPWLVSVPAIYDKRDGKRMYGHGVGMSARDAAYMADEEELDYRDILKYYYSGVEIERIYR